ncbi:MAG: tRNA (adenosine(37)-N6)-threonylcarbamoyltransferase complex ATPase subunit type 1 TsaE [Hirschia sp.]|nr:tRNA (adenosine(37)-N6)-threonylcarbamoyltransferase complex ATPase subunit type 1 TsaE [Hirschia sp.]MBB37310.1 tRNA (adenosine(37)-N6)-threonylcarbamoyltransferase complex ATPase subunit type 1 TsaE [Hirschia sp.]MBF17654.1 tRNA (adenosine(37)-N6)-threonylcarbamoyltransferase complex ATPase subunit type 1 TsaE [Hirschia sp.]|tara:strand:- start:4 stop:471 length:468 start_codon:yes stop_codon:yes gene_type:complete
MTDQRHEIALKDDEATARLGRTLAEMVRPGDVIALKGDLGAGKSTLARALIRKLLQNEDLEVPSPTFTIVLTYEAEHLPIWHFDLYRLEDEQDLPELGFEDSQDGLALIEWPERMGHSLPKWRLDLELEIVSDGRIAHIVGYGPEWSERIDSLKN